MINSKYASCVQFVQICIDHKCLLTLLYGNALTMCKWGSCKLHICEIELIVSNFTIFKVPNLKHIKSKVYKHYIYMILNKICVNNLETDSANKKNKITHTPTSSFRDVINLLEYPLTKNLPATMTYDNQHLCATAERATSIVFSNVQQQHIERKRRQNNKGVSHVQCTETCCMTEWHLINMTSNRVTVNIVPILCPSSVDQSEHRSV